MSSLLKHYGKHHKVSFGSSKGSFVETVLFDSSEADPHTNATTIRSESRPGGATSKVRVTFFDGQSPHRILPSLIAEPSEKLLSDSQSTQLLSIGSVSMEEVALDENPFRPDGNLNHEVDPIVETYKRRPFPASPSHEMFASPLSADSPVLVQAANNNLQSERPPSSPEKDSPKKKKKDKGGKNSKNSSPDKSPEKTVPASPPSKEQPTTAQVQHHTLASPQTGKVELVHLEEKPKRRCACCSLQ